MEAVAYKYPPRSSRATRRRRSSHPKRKDLPDEIGRLVTKTILMRYKGAAKFLPGQGPEDLIQESWVRILQCYKRDPVIRSIQVLRPYARLLREAGFIRLSDLQKNPDGINLVPGLSEQGKKTCAIASKWRPAFDPARSTIQTWAINQTRWTLQRQKAQGLRKVKDGKTGTNKKVPKEGIKIDIEDEEARSLEDSSIGPETAAELSLWWSIVRKYATPAEYRLLRMVAQGMTTAEITKKLGFSRKKIPAVRRTVQATTRRMRRKVLQRLEDIPGMRRYAGKLRRHGIETVGDLERLRGILGDVRGLSATDVSKIVGFLDTRR